MLFAFYSLSCFPFSLFHFPIVEMQKFTGIVILLNLICQSVIKTEEFLNIFASCTSKENCANCIRSPGCSWCSQGDFHGADKQQFARCNTTEGHLGLGRFQCQTSYLFTPESGVNITRSDHFSKEKAVIGRPAPIKPQEASVKLRAKVPVEIELEYKDPQDYPLELYYLMDLTKTMEDDKRILSNLGEELGKRLKELTNEYKQGFGSFIDKVAMPYVRMTTAWLKNPCLNVGNCIKPYGYKHHLSLSQDLTRFSKEVNKTKLSASVDKPEGGFDALMQVMVCGEKIGWTQGSRKVVIFATDAPFHIAGDGKLGGIIRRNDEKCYLNEEGDYTHSTEMDYPSIAQLNHQSIQNSVITIFAVTQENLEIYSQLASRIEGAKSALLSEDSSNIVDLVVDEYKKITSTVKMSDDFPKPYINVTYLSKCAEGEESNTNVCRDLPVGSSVKFKVRLELLQCPTNKDEWKKRHRIYRVGLSDSLFVDLEMMCDCPCEDEANWIPNSPKCGGHGTEKCGLCECYDPYFGKLCECNAKGGPVPDDEIKACMADNSTEVCSGRGICYCGQCECEKRQNPEEKYSGRHCECDNFSCEKYNGEICGGQGICDCGLCDCHSGWSGSACECSTDKGTCVQPGTDDLCNTNGECECGKCVCEGKYSGLYCEKCLHESCPTRCEELGHCVQCKLYGTGEYSNVADCELKCSSYPIEFVDIISQDTSSDDEVLCKRIDSTDNCAFYFVYQESKNGIKYVDAQKPKECPPKPPIFWILLAIIAGIVVAGLCLVITWKLYTVVLDRREYARFESESKNAAFSRNDNPIYNTPNVTYQNPIYGKQLK